MISVVPRIARICKAVIKKSRPKWTALIISVIPRCRRAAALGTGDRPAACRAV